MRILLALAVGYAIGAKGGGKDFDDLVRSIKAVCESEEFGDFVAAARSHVGSSVARGRVDRRRIDDRGPDDGQDLVEQVRHLFATRLTGAPVLPPRAWRVAVRSAPLGSVTSSIVPRSPTTVPSEPMVGAPRADRRRQSPSGPLIR